MAAPHVPRRVSRRVPVSVAGARGAGAGPRRRGGVRAAAAGRAGHRASAQHAPLLRLCAPLHLRLHPGCGAHRTLDKCMYHQTFIYNSFSSIVNLHYVLKLTPSINFIYYQKIFTSIIMIIMYLNNVVIRQTGKLIKWISILLSQFIHFVSICMIMLLTASH